MNAARRSGWWRSWPSHKRFSKSCGAIGSFAIVLSHLIRELEARLGVRLLTRTTRSVSPTEARGAAAQAVAPRMEEIGAELAALTITATSRPEPFVSQPQSTA